MEDKNIGGEKFCLVSLLTQQIPFKRMSIFQPCRVHPAKNCQMFCTSVECGGSSAKTLSLSGRGLAAQQKYRVVE